MTNSNRVLPAARHKRPARALVASLLAALSLIATSALPAAAATPITTTVTNLVVPAGDNFLPVNGVTIPAGYTSLTVIMDVTNWQTTDNIFILASYSTDGGATWSDQGGVGTNGGPHFDRQGNPGTGFVSGVPAGTGVKVRAHFIVPSSQQISGRLTLT